MSPTAASPRAARRVRAAAAGVVLALVAFELALQIGAFVLFHTARRDGTASADGREVVLCVGDSFTFGLGSSDSEHAYPAAMQRVLDAGDGSRFRVVNGGRPGRSSADVLRRLPAQLAEHRPSHVVVLAGYPEDMKRLLAHNPGLKSRFVTVLAFDDYSAEELMAIAEAMMALTLMDHLLRHRAQNGAVEHTIPVIPAQADK